MTPTEISVTVSCVGTAVSILSAGWIVTYHCRQDDRKRGAQDERSCENTRRITALEQRQDER